MPPSRRYTFAGEVGVGQHGHGQLGDFLCGAEPPDRDRRGVLIWGIMPVTTSAGAMASTVTPPAAYVLASQYSMPWRPDFDAAQRGSTMPPVKAATDETNKMSPKPRSAMPVAARVPVERISSAVCSARAALPE
jgi:hypothetical protein